MQRLFFLIFLVFFSSLVFISCGNASEETEVTETPVQDASSLYGNKNFSLPKLSESVRKELSQWTVYDDFETEARAVNGSNLEELKVRAERLVMHTDSLSKKIPDTIQTNTIATRLAVVKTRANLLLQEAKKARVDSATIQEYIEETNIAVRNFILQLNEKFQKDAIDQQRFTDEKEELKKQGKFLDSVYQIELQDKKLKKSNK